MQMCLVLCSIEGDEKMLNIKKKIVTSMLGLCNGIRFNSNNKCTSSYILQHKPH